MAYTDTVSCIKAEGHRKKPHLFIDKVTKERIEWTDKEAR